MLTRTLHAVYIALLLSSMQGIASAQLDDAFGASMHALSESQAKAFSGVAQAGVGIDSVTPGSVADSLDLKAGDEILEINGSVATTTDAVTGIARAKDDSNYVIYARQGRRRSIYTASPASTRVLFVLPPDVIDDPDNEYKDIAKATGLSARFSPTLPGELGDYAAVILLNPKICRPGVADTLRAYLKHGGAVVMAEMIPVLLVDNSRTIINGDFPVDDISDWLGTSKFIATIHTVTFENSVQSDDDDRLSVALNYAVGSKMAKGDEVFAYRSRECYLGCPESANSDAVTPAAWWDNCSYYQKRVAGAIYNRYGRGRVYWQFEATEPSYPRVQELLIAGIRWAAGVAAASPPRASRDDDNRDDRDVGGGGQRNDGNGQAGENNASGGTNNGGKPGVTLGQILTQILTKRK